MLDQPQHLSASLDLLLFDMLSSSWTYQASFLILAISLPSIAFLIGRFLWPWLYGQPLATWVLQHRIDPSQEQARRLSAIRKTLGTLAHDVLKHRLLGLVSLIQSLDAPQPSPNESEPPAKEEKSPQSRWESLRPELLRLCGARAAPRDRLWARWSEAFSEVRSIAMGRIAPPWADLQFSGTDRTLQRLRKLIRAFVAGERADALSLERIRALKLAKVGDIHREILQIAEGCRPLINPHSVVEETLSALSALVDRQNALQRIHTELDVQDIFLIDAPPRLIAICLERLLDNALRLSPEGAPISLKVELEQDDLFGDEVLIFRVLDTLETIPKKEDFGVGLRETQHALAEYECGVSFERFFGDGPFVKEARITMPVRRCEPLEEGRRSLVPLRFHVPLILAMIALVVLSITRILGGAPVKFAGESAGDPVVEFRREVGELLEFPLCEGGNDPSVELIFRNNNACKAPECSLGAVVQSIQPCQEGLSAPGCPKIFRWRPNFGAGSRRGTSYELSLRCSESGPPESEDSRRIRILVSRPNSPPTLNAIQLERDPDLFIPIKLGEPNEIAAGDQLILIASANDVDDDPLRFKLVPDTPPGAPLPFEPIEVRQDAQGYGRLNLSKIPWQGQDTFSVRLLVSDNGKEWIEQRLRFKATQLNPVRLVRLTLEGAEDGEHVECLRSPGGGSKEEDIPDLFRVCQLGEGQRYELTIKAWFDELLKRVDDHLSITSDARSRVQVVRRKEMISFQKNVQILPVWELRTRDDNELLATLRLLEKPLSQEPGYRRYRFLLEVHEASSTTPPNWPLHLTLAEASGRTTPLEMMLVLNPQHQGGPLLQVSPNTLRLHEYELESDAHQAHELIQVTYLDSAPIKLSSPVIRCGSPELFDAFEKPYFKVQSPNLWQLHLSLKPGCIDGLGNPQSRLGDEASRTCHIDLSTEDGKARASIEVHIEDRPCRPKISRLAPADPTTEVEEGTPVTWFFEIKDPDGDLDKEGIQVRGGKGFSLSLKKTTGEVVDHFRGQVKGDALCGDAQGRLGLQVRDRSGRIMFQSMKVPTRCRPTLSTSKGENFFEVDNGEQVSITIEGAPASELIMEKRSIGRLIRDTFSWRADCKEGLGPHMVQISAKEHGETSSPLRLQIQIRKCPISFHLEANGTSMSSVKPFKAAASRTHQIRVVPEVLRPQDVEIKAFLEPSTGEMGLIESRTDKDFFFLSCRDHPESRMLVVKVMPGKSKESRYSPSPPISILVHCGL